METLYGRDTARIATSNALVSFFVAYFLFNYFPSLNVLLHSNKATAGFS